MTTTAKTDERARYVVRRRKSRADAAAKTREEEDAIIARALAILSNRLRQPGAALTSPNAVREYLGLLLAEREHEVFVCLWLDAKHRVLKCEELFRGTITKANVYPREVVKAALATNAAAVIFAHNHPSGDATPSQDDRLLTRSLQEALTLFEVKVLDHFIVAGENALSFAERGLL
jgi:DNA repair protein RadC